MAHKLCVCGGGGGHLHSARQCQLCLTSSSLLCRASRSAEVRALGLGQPLVCPAAIPPGSCVVKHTLMSANRLQGAAGPVIGGRSLRTRLLGNPGLRAHSGPAFFLMNAPWIAESVRSQFGKFTARFSVVPGECLRPGPALCHWRSCLVLRGVRCVASRCGPCRGVRGGAVLARALPSLLPASCSSVHAHISSHTCVLHVCLLTHECFLGFTPGRGLLVRAVEQV